MAFNFDFESYDFENPNDDAKPYKKYMIEIFHFPMMSSYRVNVKEQWWKANAIMTDENGNKSELTDCETYEGSSAKKANEMVTAYLNHISKFDSSIFLGFTLGGDITDDDSEAGKSVVHTYDPFAEASKKDPDEKVWLYKRSYTKN